MTIEKIELVKIRPSDGHVLTNGREYAPDYMHLGKGANLDDWYEITKEEYEKILKEEEDAMSKDAPYPSDMESIDE